MTGCGAPVLWGRHPCLPVRAASCRPFLTADVRRGGTGNTGQGCPVNRQAGMPAAHPPRSGAAVRLRFAGICFPIARVSGKNRALNLSP